jgi:hypothetical protein
MVLSRTSSKASRTATQNELADLTRPDDLRVRRTWQIAVAYFTAFSTHSTWMTGETERPQSGQKLRNTKIKQVMSTSGVCVCVCVCVCERERERERECVCAKVLIKTLCC